VILRPLPDGPGIPTSLDAAGLLVRLKLDEGSGQTLSDSSGTGRHFTLGFNTGAEGADPTWTAYGVSFSGGQRIAQVEGAFVPSGPLTMLVVHKTPAASTERRFLLAVNAVGAPFFELDNSNRAHVYGTGLTSTSAHADGTWHASAFTYDFAGSGPRAITLYRDGAEDGLLGTLNTGAFTEAFLAGGQLNTSEFAQVLVYNVVKNAGEMASIYARLRFELAARGVTLP
jgi:hypothetical protein